MRNSLKGHIDVFVTKILEPMDAGINHTFKNPKDDAVKMPEGTALECFDKLRKCILYGANGEAKRLWTLTREKIEKEES